MNIKSASKIALVTAIAVLSFGLTAAPLASAATNNKLAPCAVKTAKKYPKTTTKNEVIGYGTTRQNDATLAQGTTKEVTPGHKGNRVITYTATYKKNKLVGCKHTGTNVSIKPQNHVITVGTYIAPAPAPVVTTPTPVVTPAPAPTPAPSTGSTYTNVDGNQIESPDSNAAGASAQCRDGSYSHSVHRSGTCSGHGGVATWL